MKDLQKTGHSHEASYEVTPSHTIEFAKGNMPAVLATPWLIWFLEQTALDLMLPFLEEGEITVGTQVDIEHLAPTPCGETVTCRARVIHSDGPTITFHVEASDRHERISKGLHKRRVVSAARLAARVNKKAQG